MANYSSDLQFWDLQKSWTFYLTFSKLLRFSDNVLWLRSPSSLFHGCQGQFRLWPWRCLDLIIVHFAYISTCTIIVSVRVRFRCLQAFNITARSFPSGSKEYFQRPSLPVYGYITPYGVPFIPNKCHHTRCRVQESEFHGHCTLRITPRERQCTQLSTWNSYRPWCEGRLLHVSRRYGGHYLHPCTTEDPSYIIHGRREGRHEEECQTGDLTCLLGFHPG